MEQLGKPRQTERPEVERTGSERIKSLEQFERSLPPSHKATARQAISLDMTKGGGRIRRKLQSV